MLPQASLEGAEGMAWAPWTQGPHGVTRVSGRSLPAQAPGSPEGEASPWSPRAPGGGSRASRAAGRQPGRVPVCLPGRVPIQCPHPGLETPSSRLEQPGQMRRLNAAAFQAGKPSAGQVELSSFQPLPFAQLPHSTPRALDVPVPLPPPGLGAPSSASVQGPRLLLSYMNLRPSGIKVSCLRSPGSQ